EVTTTQRARGPTTVEGTERALTDRLVPFAADLPCDAATAGALLDAYSDGGSVEDAARAAGLAPVAGAKALHLLGVDGLTPLSPLARDIVADWLAGELPRSDALALTGVSEHEFALGAFVEAHDPLPDARAVVDGEFLR
ncbi:hypothetical protein U3A55_08420, partial [Salarchaeum sp. III]|uniref:DUF7858 family protein n=1 Tax=Salarchaeum sp. III TaxID=3107927 RepID=UPI002ED7FA5B